MQTGDPFDETGLLIREGGAFFLQHDVSGRFLLTLKRVPIDEVEKQVRVIGTYAGDTSVDVDGIQLVAAGRSAPFD